MMINLICQHPGVRQGNIDQDKAELDHYLLPDKMNVNRNEFESRHGRGEGIECRQEIGL